MPTKSVVFTSLKNILKMVIDVYFHMSILKWLVELEEEELILLDTYFI